MLNSLNLQVVEAALRNGELDEDFYVSLLNDPYAVRNLYYKDNLGAPPSARDSVKKILDENAPNILGLEMPLLDSAHSIINASIFTTGEFTKNLSYFAESLFGLGFKPTVIILSHANNFEAIYKYIHENEIRDLSLGFFYAFIFRAASKGVKLDFERLSRNVSSLSEKDICFVEAIFRDKANAEKSRPEASSKGNLKIALFVSGQVRSDLSIHHSLQRFLGCDLGNQVDLFFSSWRKKGVTKITEAKSPRFFTKEARESIERHLGGFKELDLDYFDSLLLDKLQSVDHDYVESNFSFCDNKYINIDDETCSPFSEMTNPEKMYYHNSVWMQKLGHDFFSQYDLIIKIRPDSELTSFDLEKVRDNISDFEFMTDYGGGWIYEVWGLGVGDQVLVAKPNVMFGLLGLYNLSGSEPFSKQLLEKLGEASYAGHINLAIRALELGFKPVPNRFFSKALRDNYTFNRDDVVRYLETKGYT